LRIHRKFISRRILLEAASNAAGIAV
jgi:hypothetical protein